MSLLRQTADEAIDAGSILPSLCSMYLLRDLSRRFRNYFVVASLVVVGAILISLLSFGAGLFADSELALRTAAGVGVQGAIIVDEHRFFPGLQGCSEEDAAAFDIVGVNASGDPVELTVCVGWPFKGATPRFR